VKAAGLPNIVGSFGDYHANQTIGNGPFKIFQNSTLDRGGGSGKEVYMSSSFDASRSNKIYGSSNTVQLPSIVLIPQLRY